MYILFAGGINITKNRYIKFHFAKNIIFISIILLIFSGVGSAQYGDEKTVSIGYVMWDGSIASTNVMKEVLEQAGYDVEIIAVDTGPLYQALAEGHIDFTTSAWLPQTHSSYWDQYGNQIDSVAVNLEDPRMSYGEADQVKTLARKGLEDEKPELYAIISNFHWNHEEIQTVMADMEAGMSAENAAAKWVENNPDRVNEWLSYNEIENEPSHEPEPPAEPVYEKEEPLVTEEPEEPEEPAYELNKYEIYDVLGSYAIPMAFIFVVGIITQIAKIGGKRKTSSGKQTTAKKKEVVTHHIDNKLENTTPSKTTTKDEIPNVNYSENNKIERVENNADFCIKSAFNYKGATIQYKVKVENPTSEPFADIKVNLYIPDVFILSESTKSIPILKPSESKTVTFDIRPTGECGDCEVSGKVVYYDYKTKKTTEAPIPSKNVSIVCPMINSRKIDESQWRDTLTGLTKAEETTREIDIPASTLFDMASDVLQDMNLFMLDPKVNDSDNLYRAVAKFYGEGVKDLKYAAQIEIVGGSKKSKLILKAWAEKEEALTGFYHGILDELEKRTQIKGNINENIIQNYYHYGDKVGTQISDSLVQRSNIGVSNSGDKDEYQIPESIEDHQINSKSYDELSYDGVYNYLVDVAHKACGNKSKILNNIDSPSHRKSLYEKGIIVTYGDVLKIFGKIPNNRAHQMELIKILDDINRNNKPILLSSLVVNGDKYRPSEQFFKKWTNNSWESELEKIWDYYCD